MDAAGMQGASNKDNNKDAGNKQVAWLESGKSKVPKVGTNR